MLKAILFDLDDTLIDWGAFLDNWEDIESRHLPAVFDYVCSLGEITADFDGYRQEFNQRVRDAWMQARVTLIAPHLGRILVETSIALGIDESLISLQTCLEMYKWNAVEGTYVFPDVVEGLTSLRDKGLRFGIVTNAFQPMMMRDVELATHGLLEFFPECRFSAADVGYLKPHPNIFEAALNCLGCDPDDAIFVGDNPTADIAGAQAAGMRAVLRVKHPPARLVSGLVIPDGAINTLHDLPPLLDEWYPGWDS